MTIVEYINKKFDGNKSRFARAQGVLPAQITQWEKRAFIVIDDKLYGKRRDLREGNECSVHGCKKEKVGDGQQCQTHKKDT